MPGDRPAEPQREHAIGMVAAVMICVIAGADVARAAPALIDSFDAAESAWQFEPSPVARPLQQQRVRVTRDDEQVGVEWVRYRCRPGYSAVCYRPIGRAPVLDELRVSVTLRCEQPGAVLAARVVLPRTVDPATGKPRTVTIRGGRYEQTNQWATITLDQTPRRTAGAARLLRTLPGAPSIDERGAYVDRVVLLLPGAASLVSVWTDEFSIDGVLLPGGGRDAAPADARLPELASEPPPEAKRVVLGANGFTIGGRPFFPRVWTYQGGSLRAV
ncbi:MAG: hypothetical protein AAGG46_01685, partial [Planctomycetota bacterium]